MTGSGRRGPYTVEREHPLEAVEPQLLSGDTLRATAPLPYRSPGNTARFSAPSAVTMGPGGIFYVVERSGGNRVRTLRWMGGDPMSAQNWQVGLLAGAADGSAGYVNATGSAARFSDPRGIAVGPDGTVSWRHLQPLFAITPMGVTTLPGQHQRLRDARAARPVYCLGLCVGPDG